VSEFSRFELASGVNLHVWHEPKFKTISTRLLSSQRLRPVSVSYNALLPRVLRRGTQSYPSMRRISAELEQLYGSRLVTDVAKIGGMQVMVFGLDCVSGSFVGEAASLYPRALGLLDEVVHRPCISGGAFRSEFVEQEKDALSKQIRAMVNDKTQYSLLRCIEEMYSGEPYGLHQLGSLDEVRDISADTLFAHYEHVRMAPVDVLVAGNIHEEHAISSIQEAFELPERTVPADDDASPRPEPREVRQISEHQPVAQAKLSMGFRTFAAYPNDSVYPTMLFEGILGGFPHSKLFINVREKHSLAYYAQSILDPSQGAMFVIAGIEPTQYQRASEIILQQVELIRQGEFTQFEMEATRSALVNRLKSSLDSCSAVMGAYYEQMLSGEPKSVQDRLERLNAVTRQQIVEAAQRTVLDTVHLLSPAGGVN